MNILIVEDETRVADFLARGLRAERHNVTVVGDGEAGVEAGLSRQFDVIILDLLLPRMHGHEVCQTLRQQGMDTAILMLTALGALEDRVTGLRLGADDYLAKPFAFDELLARIAAITRRNRNLDRQQSTLTMGDLSFDPEAMEVVHGGKPLKLTAKELAVLELLLSTPGKIFSRERILSNVWDLSEDPLTNIIDVYIGRLRKHLRSTGGSVSIETIRGIGYRLVVGLARDEDVCET